MNLFFRSIAILLFMPNFLLANYCEDYLRSDTLENRFSSFIDQVKKYPANARFAKKQEPIYVGSIPISRSDNHSFYAYDLQNGLAINQRLIAELPPDKIKYEVQKDKDAYVHSIFDSSFTSRFAVSSNKSKVVATTEVYVKGKKLEKQVWKKDNIHLSTDFSNLKGSCIPERRVRENTAKNTKIIEVDIYACRDLRAAFKKNPELSQISSEDELRLLVQKILSEHDIENLDHNTNIDYDLYLFRSQTKKHDGFDWHIGHEDKVIAKAYDLLASCYTEKGFKDAFLRDSLWEQIPTTLNPKDYQEGNQ